MVRLSWCHPEAQRIKMAMEIKFYQYEIIDYLQCKRTLLKTITSESSDVGQGLFTFKGFCNNIPLFIWLSFRIA